MHPHSYTTDTSADAEVVQLDLFRKMTPAQRLETTLRLSSEMLRAAKAAIRRRYPEFSEQEVTVKFVELHYGTELAAGVRNRLSKRAP